MNNREREREREQITPYFKLNLQFFVDDGDKTAKATKQTKCSKCSNDAKYNEVSITNKDTRENKVIYNQPICELCSEELLKCQECKNKQAEHVIKKGNVEVILCGECEKKNKEQEKKCKSKKNSNCDGKVYKDNLCVKCYDEEHPNIKGWKCDICQRVAGDKERFITTWPQEGDPITYCPECKAKADKEKAEKREEEKKPEKPKEEKKKPETSKKEPSKDKEVEIKKIKDFGEIEKKEFIEPVAKEPRKEGLCQECLTLLASLQPQKWEANKLEAKNNAKRCEHNAAGTYFFNNKNQRIATANGIGSVGMGTFNSRTAVLCDKCNKYNHGTAWNDFPPCCQQENNNQNQPYQAPSNQQSLNLLTQLQVFFQANNIQSITQQPNGDLLITFNSNNSATSNPANPNQPNSVASNPSQQIITNEQITDVNSLMEPEQKKLWKNYKNWAKENNKSELNAQELDQEINKLKTNTSAPLNYTPILIVGGLVLAGIIGLIVLFLTKNKKKVREYE